jgi:hypothetical protein
MILSIFLVLFASTCVYADGAGSVALHWYKGDFSVEPVWDAEDYQYDVYLSRNNRGVLTNQEREAIEVWLEFQPADKLAVAAFITVGETTGVNAMKILLPPQSETAFEVNLVCVPDGDKPLNRMDLGTLTLTVSGGDAAMESPQVIYSDRNVSGGDDALPIIINRLDEESSIPEIVDTADLPKQAMNEKQLNATDAGTDDQRIDVTVTQDRIADMVSGGDGG